MSENLTSHFYLYLNQSVVFGVLSYWFLIYLRGFNKQYLKYWLYCLISLTVNNIANMAINFNVYELQTTSLQIFYISVQQVSHYISLIFLILGIYSSRFKHRFSFRFITILITLASVLGIVSTVLYGFDNENLYNRFYLRTSLHSFIFGCGFLAISFYLFIEKKQNFTTSTMIIFSIIYGLRYLLHSFISIIAISSYWYKEFELFLIYFDVAANSLMGFVLFIWMQGAERKEAVNAISRAQYLNKHDLLTGALNREQVMTKLPQIMNEVDERESKLAIFLIDIKHFKFINDNYGLKAGDFILGEVAKRLNESIFLPQVVARLSGDSFLFVIEFELDKQVDRTVEHLHEIINLTYYFHTTEINIQASIGYCLYPEDAIDAESLLQNANLALNHAETNSLISVAYLPGMEAEGRRLLAREKELKEALKNDEFVLYFQPQLNLYSNRIEGVECLIRWQHPQKGLLYPADFLDDIEKLGMHSVFDNYVLKKGCQAHDRWFKKYKRRVAFAINITSVEFQDPKLIQNIQTLLLEYHLPSKYLELEITENVVMTDIETAMTTIFTLQNMGIKVSIDDFGTGYSSLAYLRKLPIDKIKIDRSFITEVATNDSDLTIVKSMVELSHGLGKRVLAEGVENVDQLNVLRNLGCDAVQGYLINKPLSEERWVTYLKKK